MSSPIIVPSGIDLQTVELVSTLRPAPKNGAPSSADYYSSEQEKIVDLATFESFINNTLLPIINALPPQAAEGLEGTSVYTDTSSQDVLSFNSLTSQYLTVTDTMRAIYGWLQSLQTKLADNSLELAALEQRLSSSNQNDISLALQSLTQEIQNQGGEINILQQTISSMQLLVGNFSDARVETPIISPEAIESVAVIWTVPFPDNTYTVSYGIEDSSGFLQINGFSYLPSGQGVLIRVLNQDTNGAHQGYVHTIGRVSQLATSG